MAVRMQVEAKGRTYTVVEDLTSIFEVLVEGSVVDDVTGDPPRTAVQLDADREGVFLKALENGVYCLAGELERVLPQHGTTAHSFELRISAHGYLPQTLTVTAPAAGALPVVLPEVRLRPFPVRVQGRVVQSSTNRSAAAGAVVRIVNVGAQGRLALRTPLHADHGSTTPVQRRNAAPTGVVRTLARDATPGTDVIALTGAAVAGTPVLGFVPQAQLEFVPVAAAGPGPGEVTLTQPLSRSYPAGTLVAEFTFTTPAGSPVRQLTRDATRGTDVVALTGAAVTGTPVLGFLPQTRLEFVPVAAAGPGPGEVTLTQPLTRSHPAGTPVAEFTFTTPAGSPVRQLTRDALAGDGLLLLDDVIGLAATAVQVGDAGSGPIELHAVGALADGDGYYTLDGVGGVTEITLRARPTPTGLPGPTVPWTIDYGRSSNLVNLQLAP